MTIYLFRFHVLFFFFFFFLTKVRMFLLNIANFLHIYSFIFFILLNLKQATIVSIKNVPYTFHLS